MSLRERLESEGYKLNVARLLYSVIRKMTQAIKYRVILMYVYICVLHD